MGDYISAPSQDAEQLLDGDGSVPARSLPQEAEAGIDGSAAAATDREGTSCVRDVSNYHHHHGPSKDKVTVSGQHLSIFFVFFSPSSESDR